jgi:murein DD-endopeptidase MepM/ murein hydrolase activator NlpD
VGFLDPSYPEWRRRAGLRPAEHPGIDLNLLGTSGDQDLGYPVVAIADGVVRAARPYAVWGNIVLVEHPELAGWLNLPYLASQYAHLHQVCVEVGQRVWAGEPVGSIGKGDPRAPFLAHLHFEIRRAEMDPDAWPGIDRATIQRNYVDPAAFLKQYGNPTRRFVRATSRLYSEPGVGVVIINLEDPYTAHIRWGK